LNFEGEDMFNRKLSCALVFAVVLCGFVLPLQAETKIAILNSANSRAFFALHYAECAGSSVPGGSLGGGAEYERYVRGWEYALTGYDINWSPIDDDDVSEAGLEKVDLLILANAVSLSDDQMKAIERWVRRGGRLLATFGSGYKDIVLDARQDDLLKLQNGGTGGLHNLWRDPMTKLFSNNSLGLGVPFVRLTRPFGGWVAGTEVPYGFLANMLVQRPEARDDVYGFLVFDPASWNRPAPAILINRASRGLVVYLAFAPEFAVALENNLPRYCGASGVGHYTASANAAATLMRSAVEFLIDHL
jgi:hypothetical protein